MRYLVPVAVASAIVTAIVRMSTYAGWAAELRWIFQLMQCYDIDIFAVGLYMYM